MYSPVANCNGTTPYGDFGWWSQDNGYQCPEDCGDQCRDYCYINVNETNVVKRDHNNICNWPRGTDGQQFHPYVKDNERLWIFQTDICRSLYMNYQVRCKLV